MPTLGNRREFVLMKLLEIQVSICACRCVLRDFAVDIYRGPSYQHQTDDFGDVNQAKPRLDKARR